MKNYEFALVGVAPISYSKAVSSVKGTGELPDVFEERTWKERLHHDVDGNVFIPPTACKNALAEAAKFLSESVPGKRGATYTKHFESGVMIVDPMPLLYPDGSRVHKDKVDGERIFVPSDGRPGGGKRVWKTFPFVSQWKTTGKLCLLDPLLIDKPEKVREYLEYAGQFIGFLRFRPRNRGYYGRFTVEKFEAVA